MKFISYNVAETQKLAKQIAKALKGGEIIGLQGELGSGKTAFVQGLAKGLGIKETVNSPTFVLMKIYKLAKPQRRIKQLVHLDAYRLNKLQELLDIGFNDFAGKEKVLTVIEWADKFPELKKLKNYREISLRLGKKSHQRQIDY